MRSLLVLPFLLMPQLGQAAEMTVGAYGGWLWTDDLEMLHSSWNAAPRLTYHYDDAVGIEGDLAFMTGTTRIGEFDYLALMPRLTLVGNLAPEEKIQPLLMFGPGLFYKKTDDPQGRLGEDYVNPDVDFLGTFGPGLQVPLGDVAVIRTDYRAVANFGTESYRNRGDAFLNWQWSLGFGVKIGGEPDQDKDGVSDELDQCVDNPEDIDQFEDEDGCPDEDNDKDGILDAADQCRDEAEDKDGWQDEDGCAEPDNDEDGLLDADDRCPDASGAKELEGCPDKDADMTADIDDVCPDDKGDVELGGCPDGDKDGVADVDDECPEAEGPDSANGCPDKDGDRIPDKDDACPDEPADPRVNPRRSDGCLTRAFFAKGALVITEKVKFATGSAKIDARSNKLLDEVAAAFTKWGKKVKKVEVQGHTDSTGDADKNLKLSQERAEAVMAYLVTKGIEADKLVAKGYGSAKAVESNDTKEGQEANRRIEFVVLEDDFKARERTGKKKGKDKGGDAPGK